MACACPTCGQTLPQDETLRIDPAGIVARGGAFTTITARKELELLLLLQVAEGRFVSRASIEEELWPVVADLPEGEVIQSHVSKINRKLRPLGASIQGAPRGVGAYRLVVRIMEARAT